MTLDLTKTETARILRDRTRKTRQREAKAVRPKSVKADRGRVRNPGFLAFIRRQPCLCMSAACEGAVQAAHIRFGDAARGKPVTGMQVKPDDRWALPLCRYHHADQHSMNERQFWKLVGLDPLATAERLFAEYSNPGANP